MINFEMQILGQPNHEIRAVSDWGFNSLAAMVRMATTLRYQDQHMQISILKICASLVTCRFRNQHGKLFDTATRSHCEANTLTLRFFIETQRAS